MWPPVFDRLDFIMTPKSNKATWAGNSDSARNKHALANELDEPLRNLFQWASLCFWLWHLNC